MSRTTLDQFVERYGPDVYRAARLYTGDAALAEDVAQEVLIAAVQTLHQMREPSRWLARVTHNKALNALRAQGRRREVSLNEEHDAPVDDPADRYEESDVVQAVQQLPVPLREAVVLRYELISLSGNPLWERGCGHGENEFPPQNNAGQASSAIVNGSVEQIHPMSYCA